MPELPCDSESGAGRGGRSSAEMDGQAQLHRRPISERRDLDDPVARAPAGDQAGNSDAGPQRRPSRCARHGELPGNLTVRRTDCNEEVAECEKWQQPCDLNLRCNKSRKEKKMQRKISRAALAGL